MTRDEVLTKGSGFLRRSLLDHFNKSWRPSKLLATPPVIMARDFADFPLFPNPIRFGARLFSLRHENRACARDVLDALDVDAEAWRGGFVVFDGLCAPVEWDYIRARAFALCVAYAALGHVDATGSDYAHHVQYALHVLSNPQKWSTGRHFILAAKCVCRLRQHLGGIWRVVNPDSPAYHRRHMERRATWRQGEAEAVTYRACGADPFIAARKAARYYRHSFPTGLKNENARHLQTSWLMNTLCSY